MAGPSPQGRAARLTLPGDTAGGKLDIVGKKCATLAAEGCAPHHRAGGLGPPAAMPGRPGLEVCHLGQSVVFFYGPLSRHAPGVTAEVWTLRIFAHPLEYVVHNIFVDM